LPSPRVFNFSSRFSAHFGFEHNIIWTKPCIINRILKDSPADRSHLEPGDFLIFVDKVNVVDLKQSEIQDLIRDKEALTVEVFRRADMKMQIQNLEKSPIKSLSTTTNRTLSSINVETSIESSSSNEVKRNTLISKVSTESKKRPLVTFSKEEVKGEREVKEVLV
jgi:PDZ domain